MLWICELVLSVGREGLNPALSEVMGRDSLHLVPPCPYLVPQDGRGSHEL